MFPSRNWRQTGRAPVIHRLNFGLTSTSDMLATTDALGRSHISQRRQAQGATTFDSVETDYDVMGRVSKVTVPYSAAAGGTSAGSGTSTAYDSLGRPTTVTDAGGGTVSYSYTKNDVLQSLGPAPVGEAAKQKQLQYDALGRLTSVCEVTSLSGSGTCGQTVAKTGYWTTYTYDVQGNLTGVVQNAQAGGGSQQTRSYTYDGLGRMTSEQNPETGTTSYTYDTDVTCGTSNGDLVKRVDAVGNVTCYSYDLLHRVTSMSYPSGSYASVTPTKTFVYDTAPTGYTIPYPKGRLTEAYTGPSNNKTTDLIFNYSARGEVIDTWESTPHSNGYYHVSGSYWANGALNTLGGLGLPTFTYGADGEGRPNAVTASTGTNPIPSSPGVSYNIFSQPTAFTFGSGDSDSFNYDSNTGRMTQYQYTVGTTPQTVTGNLTWNANGTLGQLAIADQLNAANTQTCNYAHDDLVRVAGVTCTNNPTNVWAQTFGYDPLGNLSKFLVTGYPGSAFTPTYSTSTNRITSSPFSYDANGNTLTDNVHSYAWDAEGKVITADSITLTYDPLGRMVEQNGTTQVVYAPTGQKFALMNGQTLVKAFVALPAGAVAVYDGSGAIAYYRHADWLGSSRLSTTPGRTVYSSLAYAPFGETYAESGTPDRSFTGQNQDTIPGSTAGLYDFLYRQHAQYGRWTSPDPAGFSAVSPATPQSWNRYAYVLNNPNILVDPQGLRFALVQLCGWVNGEEGPSYGCVPAIVWEPDDQPPSPPPDIGGGDSSNKASSPKQTCIPKGALGFNDRLLLSLLSWAAQRSGGVRAAGIGGSGALSPPSWAGGGGSVQMLWMADYLGQQGLYWSISGGPTIGTPGPGAVAGVQYMTSTYNKNVTVQDVVNSALTVGGGGGFLFGVGADYSPQTGVAAETIGFGIGGFGGASGLNIASGFIPICKK